IAPPLAPLALAGVLGHVLGAGSGHAGAGTSAGLAAAGATGKSAGAVLAAKTAAGVVIVATATVGATDVLRHANHPRPHAPITTTTGGSAKHSGAASGRSRVGHGFAAPLGGGPRANPRARTDESAPGNRGHGQGSSKAGAAHGRSGNSHAPSHGSRRGAVNRSAAGNHGIHGSHQSHRHAPQGQTVTG